MPELNSERLSDLVRLVCRTTGSTEDLLAATASLLEGAVPRGQPDLSDEEEVLLESFLDGLLSVKEELAFRDRVRNSPALCLAIASLLAEPVPTAPAEPRAVPVALSLAVTVGHGQLTRRADTRRRETRSFDLARSSSAESTSVQEEYLTALGVVRITLDLGRDNLVDMIVEAESSVANAELRCLLQDARGTTVIDGDLQGGFVQFPSIAPGEYGIVLKSRDTDATIQILIASE